MSATERDALEAGTVWWDGELFTGKPDWRQAARHAHGAALRRGAGLPRRPLRSNSARWSTTSTSRIAAPTFRPRPGSSSSANRFFAMIIPKKYGGLGFGTLRAVLGADQARAAAASCSAPRSACPTRSARASCWCTTAPRSRRTTTCRGSRAARKSPASRSPARRWAPMPRRSATPASSAAAFTRAAKCIGLQLNFSKRYITLAPVATVVGLAFRMFDPGAPARRRRGHRHHLRAAAARHAGHHASAAGISR